MVASNKEDFLFQLHNELHRIGIDADEDIFSDFEEHFKASANVGISEEETCRRLGDVKEIARNYLSFESSRINSMVAREVEAERPRVSLTKAGQSVPADLSLRNESGEAQNEQPMIEITPEHTSEEIYPDGYKERTTSTSSPNPETNSEPKAENISGSESGAAEAGKDNSTSQSQSLGNALEAAGKAVAEAAVTAGHAIKEAFSTDEVKAAGHAMADAVKNAGHSAAEAIKNSTNQNSQPKSADDGEIYPQSTDEMRKCYNDDRKGTIPPQSCDVKCGKKSYSFKEIKGEKMDPDAGKLFLNIMLDVLLWWWLIFMLGSIAIGMFSGGAGTALGAIPMLMGGAAALHFISRILLAVFMVSFGIILMLLAVLIVKGIISIIKYVISEHIKALYGM